VRTQRSGRLSAKRTRHSPPPPLPPKPETKPAHLTEREQRPRRRFDRTRAAPNARPVARLRNVVSSSRFSSLMPQPDRVNVNESTASRWKQSTVERSCRRATSIPLHSSPRTWCCHLVDRSAFVELLRSHRSRARFAALGWGWLVDLQIVNASPR